MPKLLFLGTLGTSVGSAGAFLAAALPSVAEHSDVLVLLVAVATAGTVYLFKRWMNEKDRKIDELEKFRLDLLMMLAKKHIELNIPDQEQTKG